MRHPSYKLGARNGRDLTWGTALRTASLCGLAVIGGLAVSGCGQSLTKITKHGHQFRATDAQLIQPGMSQDDVRVSLGTPTTTSRFAGGTAYYYISSTTSQMAFLTPKEIDRRVFAVYFTELGSVDRVANYGLKDGRVFDFISRKTAAANNRDKGILAELFRNLGKRGNGTTNGQTIAGPGPRRQ